MSTLQITDIDNILRLNLIQKAFMRVQHLEQRIWNTFPDGLHVHNFLTHTHPQMPHTLGLAA